MHSPTLRVVFGLDHAEGKRTRSVQDRIPKEDRGNEFSQGVADSPKS